MEEIIKTTLLEYEKSAFLVDLVKHSNGKLYVMINQTIQEEEMLNKRTVKFNPSIITDIISVLSSYQFFITSKQIIKKSVRLNSRYLTEPKKAAIQTRYLKGISIEDLAMQFDCKPGLIEEVLYNNGIEIVNNKLPKSKYYRRSKRRK